MRVKSIPFHGSKRLARRWERNRVQDTLLEARERSRRRGRRTAVSLLGCKRLRRPAQASPQTGAPAATGEYPTRWSVISGTWAI